MWDIGFWYCCIHPRERAVLAATIEGLVITLNEGIPLALWNAFWLPWAGNGEAVRTAFLSVYQFEIVEIVVDPEFPPIEAVRAKDGLVVVLWGVFLLTPPAACLEGCQQSTVPWQD